MVQPSEQQLPTRRKLRRTLGVGGLFSIGYADVGAGIYLALGLVALHAGYATPLAIGVAAVPYVLTGLTYAELSSTYPTAGGSATYAQKAFGDNVSFLAGWMLCLDYIVTAAIFAVPAIGYLSYFAPWLKQPVWIGIGAIILLSGLLLLNTLGIRESVDFTLALCLVGIAGQVGLVILGMVLVIIPGGFFSGWSASFSLGTNPSWPEFIQGITLAMVSYLGIEALAQAAEETKVAGRTLPRATGLTLVTVMIMYLLISTVAVGIVPPLVLSTTWREDPLSGVASGLPGVGALMTVWIALLGSSISIIGANAGIVGSSRTLYAMSRYRLLPEKWGRVHRKFRTPYVAILTFGLLSIALVGISSFGPLGGSVDPLLLLGNLYNVGALAAYVTAHASLIATRNTDRPTFRPFRLPLSLHFRRGPRNFELPLLPCIGLVTTAAIWVAVIATHELGRWLGLGWVLVGMGIYIYFRKRSKLPVWGRAPPSE